MHVRSATYAIYWRWTEHSRLYAAWFSRESTTATLCCTTLHPAQFRSSSESRTTRRVSSCKRLDGQTSTRCFRRCTCCLLNRHINYKLAMLTFKTQQTSSPQYLNQHISLRTSARNTRSSTVQCVPFRRMSFARRSFSTAAPLTWNSLPPAVLNCDSLSLSLSLSFSISLLSKPDWKLICFLLLPVNYSTYLFRQPLCSRLTALWLFIISYYY